MLAQNFECRFMHGYVPGFTFVQIDMGLAKGIPTTCRHPRFHLSESQSGCASSLCATCLHECMLHSDYETEPAKELCGVMPRSRARSVACIKPADIRTNPG